jgi:formate/nitrite transporter FocA (FNT family)
MLLIKIFIVVILFSIIGSLFVAWTALAKGEAGSERVVKALTLRISLSIFLFFSLILLLYFGFIH